MEQVTEEHQLELNDLQCVKSVKLQFQFKSTADICKKHLFPSRKYKNILTNANVMILSGSKYACRQRFSKMKYTNSH